MADVFIDLVEYARGLQDAIPSLLIEQFATESDVLRTIGFKTAKQGRNPFAREVELAGLAFRGINEDPEISHGQREEFQDMCYPISGLLELDRVITNRYGAARQIQEMRGQMKRGAAIWTDTFIDGDNATEPKEFSGLKARLVADSAGNIDGSTDDSRLLTNATGSGGGVLSLAKLDLAIDLVNNPTHLLMSRRMKVKFIAAMRSTSLTGHVLHFEQESGHAVLKYAELTILTGYPPSKNNTFLPFDEVGSGGGSAVTTSIYVVSFREDGVTGIHTQPPELINVGVTDRGVQNRDLFEWDTGISIEDFYAALRLSSITDAAIAA